MKTITTIIALLFACSAQALTIQARLLNFQGTDTTVNGSGPYGGIGTFELMTDVTGTEIDFLGQEFMAGCLEWDEPIVVGATQTFEVVPLALAPTSVGGMGDIAAGWVDQILSFLGFTSVEDIVADGPVSVSAFQGALYEAGYENDPAFDRNFGSILIGGGGNSVDGLEEAAADYPDYVTSFALLNYGDTRARTVPRFQDFVVFTASEPSPLFVIGAALIVAAIARKRQSKAL